MEQKQRAKVVAKKWIKLSMFFIQKNPKLHELLSKKIWENWNEKLMVLFKVYIFMS